MNIGGGIITILVAIIGLATLAVIVGKNSQTSQVVKTAGDTFNQLLHTAVSPVA